MSQSYLAMLESGARRLTPRLARQFMRVFKLEPTVLPPEQTLPKLDPQTLAEELAVLGYPGFAYLRSRRAVKRNPVEVLVAALAQDDLEARLVEALPWLLLRYWDLDADWLVNQAKLADVQNRLGFVASVVRQLSSNLQPRNGNRDRSLADLESRLERSRLAREDTLCQSSLSVAERRWLREHRPALAARWNLLTPWQPETFRYAQYA